MPLPMNVGKIIQLTAGFIMVEVLARYVGGGSLMPIYLLGYGIGALLIAVYFDWMIPRLDYDKYNLMAALWLNLFVVGSFINMIEGWFFTTVFASPTIFLFGTVWTLFVSGIQAWLSVYLFNASGSNNIISELDKLRSGLGDNGFIKAVLLGGLGYFPVYFFFGMLVSPFVIKYYNDPALGLVIPPFTLIIPLEILRGFMFVASLLPLIIGLRDRRTLFIALAAMLFIPGSLIPMIGDVGLPTPIIPYHTVELFCDSVVYGYLLARVFTPKKD